VKISGAPSIGDIVEVSSGKPRKGLVVAEKGRTVGILYFRSSVVPGVEPDFVWWIDRTHVKIISPVSQKR